MSDTPFLPHLLGRAGRPAFELTTVPLDGARHLGRYGYPMTGAQAGDTIVAVERRNSLALVLMVALGIAVGLRAADGFIRMETNAAAGVAR